MSQYLPSIYYSIEIHPAEKQFARENRSKITRMLVSEKQKSMLTEAVFDASIYKLPRKRESRREKS